MMKRHLSVASVSSLLFLVPAIALAVPNGPRITVQGIVQAVRITEEEKFIGNGGEYDVLLEDGTTMTIVVDDDTEFIMEGRASRKQAIPTDIRKGMGVRVRGLRVDGSVLKASLLIVTNIEKNSELAGSGIVESISDGTIVIRRSDGTTVTLAATAETEVFVSYTLMGTQGLSFIGKKISYTRNPLNPDQVRVVRITGKPSPKSDRPTR